MPVTPLHYPFAFLIKKTDSRLSLPALVVGAVIPDIEVPIMWVFFSNLRDHFILHSLIGALTIGTILAVLITRYLYAPIISTIFNIDREALTQQCRFTYWMGVSCIIGVLSHLILDYPMHWYNPILWPWISSDAIIGPLILVFMPQYTLETAYLIARALMTVLMVALWIAILLRLYSKGDIWHRHWIGEPNHQRDQQTV